MEDEIDVEDALALAQKIVETAQRVEAMDNIVPGAVASIVLDFDGKLFKLSVSVAPPEPAT